MTGDIKSFIDSVEFHKNRLGGMGQVVLSVKSADILASGIQAMEQEIARLVNDKADMKSVLVTIENDLYNKEKILDAKEQELAELREKLEMLAEEPVAKPEDFDVEVEVEEINAMNIELRLQSLEDYLFGVGKHVLPHLPVATKKKFPYKTEEVLPVFDSKELYDKVIQLNWRVTKLEHGIGGHVYHLTREGA